MTTKTPTSPIEKLLTPLKVGNVTIRNRVFSSAHGTGFGTDGRINDRHIAYHLERARGGIGLIVIEATGVDHSPVVAGGAAGKGMTNNDNSVIEPYRKLSAALHAEGTKVFCLLSHSGRNTTMGADGAPAVAPSPVTMDRTRDVPHELEIEEIAAITHAFAAAAKRCKEGGLDGVELSFAHGNLVQEFISPVGNDRTDIYGGSEDNRLRFAREVLEACRAAVGPSYVLGIRFSLEELVPGGYPMADGLRYAKKMIEWGALDFIDISAGSNSSMRSRSYHYPTIATPARPLVPFAKAMRAETSIPVFCVGKLADPEEAEGIIAAGEADMVAMTRAHIAEPEIVKKIMDNAIDDIRTCIYCNESCFGRKQRVGDLTCVYNPRSGREHKWKPLQATQGDRKHILIVGGGPAGIEAARTAARRGHRVELHEKSDALGGQVLLAARTPHRQPYLKIIAWLENQAAKSGVEIHLGSEMTADKVIDRGADAVVIATGANDLKQPVPGNDLPNVFSARQVLAGANLGKRVVVGDWDGRHMGMSVAELLASRGHDVELVTDAFYAGIDVDHLTWHPAYERLLELGVRIHALEEIEKIEPDAVHIRLMDRKIRKAEVDSVVLCSRGGAERSLWRTLRGKTPELHAIGDCWAPRQLEQAIYEGAKLGREI